MNNGHCSCLISIWGQNLRAVSSVQVVKSLCNGSAYDWDFGGVRCMRSAIRAHSWNRSATHGLRRSSGDMMPRNFKGLIRRREVVGLGRNTVCVVLRAIEFRFAGLVRVCSCRSWLFFRNLSGGGSEEKLLFFGETIGMSRVSQARCRFSSEPTTLGAKRYPFC